jgi:hypothetical protein
MGIVRIQTPVRGLSWDVDINLYQQALQIGHDLIPFRDPTTDVDNLCSALDSDTLAQQLTAKFPDLEFTSYVDGAMPAIDADTRADAYVNADTHSDPVIIQAANGDLLLFFTTDEDGTSDIKLLRSVDGGVTWGTKTTVYTSVSADSGASPILLPGGDILCVFGTDEDGTYNIKSVLSSDHGATWGTKTDIFINASTNYQPSIISLANGDLLCAFITNEDGTADIKTLVSTNNGLTWGSKVTVYSSGGVERNAQLYLLPSGSILCFFNTTEDGAPQWKSVVSTDGGLTWDGKVTINTSAVQRRSGCILLPNGDLLFVYSSGAGVNYRASSDNGVTWSLPVVVYDGTGVENDAGVIAVGTNEFLFVFSTTEGAAGLNLMTVRGQWSGATLESGMVGDLYHYFIDLNNPFIAVDGFTTVGSMFAQVMTIYLGQYVQTGDDYSDQIPDERAGLQLAHDLAVSLNKALNP